MSYTDRRDVIRYGTDCTEYRKNIVVYRQTLHNTLRKKHGTDCTEYRLTLSYTDRRDVIHSGFKT